MKDLSPSPVKTMRDYPNASTVFRLTSKEIELLITGIGTAQDEGAYLPREMDAAESLRIRFCRALAHAVR